MSIDFDRGEKKKKINDRIFSLSYVLNTVEKKYVIFNI